MKMTFRGWSREVYPHPHTVTPVKKVGRTFFPDEEGPIRWGAALLAHGRVDGLELTGDFLVKFEFEPEELKSWLQRYVKAEPEAALRLLGKMQAEAMIALAKKAQEQKQEAESLYVDLSG